MKKTRLDTKLIVCVFVLLILQVVYLAAYSFLAAEGENSALSLFASVLALELLTIFAYDIIVLRRFVSLVPAAVLSLKNEEGEGFIPSSSFSEIDRAVETVKEYYVKKSFQSKKLLELFKISIKQPIASELFKDALPLIMDISGAEACAFYSVNYGSSKLELVDSCGFGRELYEGMDIDIGEGLEGACCKSGRICFFAEGSKDERYNTISSVAKKNFKNIMAVPVINEERCIGVLTLAYIDVIKKENITAGENIGDLLGAAYYSSARHEKFLRLSEELNLQNRLIREISEEIKEKREETEKLKAELEALKEKS